MGCNSLWRSLLALMVMDTSTIMKCTCKYGRLQLTRSSSANPKHQLATEQVFNRGKLFLLRNRPVGVI